MRIIAGDKRGTRLQTLEGEETRPTLERVKEGIFSAVQFYLPGARVLDLYAGSGQMGLEALSRGAVHCTFIDNSRQAADIIIQNAKHAGLFEACTVACMGAESFVATTRERFDILFMDPPYRKGILPALLGQASVLCSPGAFVLCESEPELALPAEVAGLSLQKQYRYGTVLVSRYRKRQEEFDTP